MIEQQLAAEKYGHHNPQLRAQFPDNFWRRFSVWAARQILTRRNNLQVDVTKLPDKGPAIIIFNHTSIMDVAALAVADPYYPSTLFPVKAEMMRYPGMGFTLKAMGAMPVDRDGHDQVALFKMKDCLSQGRTLCIAVEGTRSKNGHLQPFDATAVRFITQQASEGIPISPLVIIGAYEAFPKGAKFLRRFPIQIIAGDQLELGELTRLQSAAMIRDALVAMLPERYHPRNDQLMWTRKKGVRVVEGQNQ